MIEKIKTKIVVDTGEIAMLTEGFIRRHGGRLSYAANIIGPYPYPTQVSVSASAYFDYPSTGCFDLPANTRLYIGDACQCFEGDDIEPSRWTKVCDAINSYEKRKGIEMVRTGGDGRFNAVITVEKR